MHAFFQQKVRTWVGAMFLAVIAFWVVLFYLVERTKVIAGDLEVDYSYYYTLK